MNLIEIAWKAREKAYPWKSGTKVGCAIQSDAGTIFLGWNIEGLWMTSIHAEVCAISQLAGTKERGIEIAIVAETNSFTPCGACLDWLAQFCSEDARVFIQGKDRVIREYRLNKLFPIMPRQ